MDKKNTFIDSCWKALGFLVAGFVAIGFLAETFPWGLILVAIVGIILWFEATKPKREESRKIREIEARKRADEMIKERERQATLLKEVKDREYAIRKQLRAEIEKMPKYSNWRTAVFERCGKRCEMCGSMKELEIHHRISFDSLLRKNQITTIEKAFECDALWETDNGSVLCKECHAKMESSKYREAKISSQDGADAVQ